MKNGVVNILEIVIWLGLVLFGIYHNFRGNPIDPDLIFLIVGLGFFIHALRLNFIDKRIKDINKKVDEISRKLG